MSFFQTGTKQEVIVRYRFSSKLKKSGYISEKVLVVDSHEFFFALGTDALLIKFGSISRNWSLKTNVHELLLCVTWFDSFPYL